MKNKNGFTLVELLGVIVILAILALITIPIISNVVNDVRIKSLQNSAYGLIEAGNLYYAQYGVNSNTRFDIENNLVSSTDTDNLLKYKGSIKSGVVILNKKGNVIVCVSDGKNAAYKNYNEEKVTTKRGQTCSIDTNSYIVKLSDDGDTLTELSGEQLTSEIQDLKAEIAALKAKDSDLENNDSSINQQITNLSSRLSDINSAHNNLFKQFDILFDGEVKEGDTITLATNINNYKVVRIRNVSNGNMEGDFTVTYNLTLKPNLFIYMDNVDVMVLCNLRASTSDGINYYIDKNVQININSTGVIYYDTSHSSRWMIIGIR